MKVTDYAPRAAPFDTLLKGYHIKGAEIGVDVGAHAEAMLKHCSIQQLFLIDVWEREYYQGYCSGRLHSKGYIHRIVMLKMSSAQASKCFDDYDLDFIYFDQKHDYISVSTDLKLWWPKLKPGGILGYRNYAEVNKELKRAVDEFVHASGLKTEVFQGEIVIFKPL